MNTKETIDLLYNLKLKGMSEAYKAMTIMPVPERPDLDLAIAKLADAERCYRDNQKTQMYLKMLTEAESAVFSATTLQ